MKLAKRCQILRFVKMAFWTFLSYVLAIGITLIIVLGSAFLTGVLDGLFPRLHILKGYLGALIFLIIFLIVGFGLLYLDRRKWHLLEKIRALREQKKSA